MENFNNDHLVIFMHIPKTGGSTLRNIIKYQYKKEQIQKLPRRNAMENLISLSPKKNFKIKCTYGHHRFGIHNYFNQRFTYITMLRHPVERIISTYYFILENEKNQMHEKVKNLTFKEFILSPDPDLRIQITNHQTRYVSGMKNPDLKLAISNIKQHFSVVGITELYNESLFLMKKKLDWEDISYTKQNMTKNRIEKEEIPKKLIRIIEKNNRLDLQLYEYAKKKLLNNIAQLDQKSKADLNRFIQMQSY